MAIISRRHNFIFIKTTKTTGTSLEVYLAKQCGPDDIVTPITPPVTGHEAQNYQDKDGRQIFYNHQTLREIRPLVGEDFFNRAFKFCFERHPVDKCISYYSMLKNSPTHQSDKNPKTWDEYVERGNFPQDRHKYMDGSDKVLVDRIFHYESLQTDVNNINARLGLENRHMNIWAKHGWREHPEVSKAQRRTIMSAFSKTNDLLEYS